MSKVYIVVDYNNEPSGVRLTEREAIDAINEWAREYIRADDEHLPEEADLLCSSIHNDSDDLIDVLIYIGSSPHVYASKQILVFDTLVPLLI